MGRECLPRVAAPEPAHRDPLTTARALQIARASVASEEDAADEVLRLRRDHPARAIGGLGGGRTRTGTGIAGMSKTGHRS